MVKVGRDGKRGTWIEGRKSAKNRTSVYGYEWMLANKVARNADVLPQKSLPDPVAEYLRLKVAIASRWIRHEKCSRGLEDSCCQQGQIQRKCHDFTRGYDIWSLELPRHYRDPRGRNYP